MPTHEERKHESKDEKFRWIQLSLVGVTAGIILLTQGLKSLYFLSAMFIFIIIALFEAVGIWVLKEDILIGLDPKSIKSKLFYYKSTLIDIILLFIAFILLAIGSANLLLSTSSTNESTVNLISEPKAINLHAQELILNDNEIKGVLGYGWGKNRQSMDKEFDLNTTSQFFVRYEKELPITETERELFVKSYPDANKSDLFVNMNVNIFILISPTVDTARENYYQIIYREDLKNPKQIKFDLNIEDMGKFYSENASNGELIHIVFIKNNVIFFMEFTLISNRPLSEPERSEMIDVETAVELAKKQDAKITRILEMIK